MFNWIMFMMLIVSILGGYSHFNKNKKPDSPVQQKVQNLTKDGKPHISDINENLDTSTTQNNSSSFNNNNVTNRPLDIAPNSLVSCDTQYKNCEPKDHQNFDNPETTTHCITYSSNCLNQESISRTWKEEEVFKPAENTPSEMDYVEPEPAQIDEMERTEEPQVGTFENNPNNNPQQSIPEEGNSNNFNNQDEINNNENTQEQESNQNDNPEPPMDEFQPESEPFYESSSNQRIRQNRVPASYDVDEHKINKKKIKETELDEDSEENNDYYEDDSF